MSPAARPISGQPIETLWGQEVHDVADAKLGVQAAGGATTGASAAPNLSFVAGHAGIVDVANKWLLIPVAGVWRCNALFNCSGGAATGTGLYRMNYLLDGAIQYEVSWNSFGAVVCRQSLDITRVLTAGQKISFQSSGAQGAGTPAYAVDYVFLTLEAYTLV